MHYIYYISDIGRFQLYADSKDNISSHEPVAYRNHDELRTDVITTSKAFKENVHQVP